PCLRDRECPGVPLLRGPGDMVCPGLRDRRDPAQDEDAGHAVGARSCPGFRLRRACGAACEPTELLESRRPAPRVRRAAARSSKNHLPRRYSPAPSKQHGFPANHSDAAADPARARRPEAGYPVRRLQEIANAWADPPPPPGLVTMLLE